MGGIIGFVLFCIFFIILTIYIRKLWTNFQTKKLNNYISNTTIDSIDSLSGQDFEEFLYYLFLNLGFDVEKTKSSHDYGADLILKVNNISIAVQSKLYFNHSVGSASVQEVYSSTKYYNTNAGVVITNSYFTKSAISLANSTNVILWDRNMLINLLNLKDIEKKIFKNKLICSIIADK